VNACFLPTYRLAVATTRLCDRCWQPSARSTFGWQVSVGVRARIRDRKTGCRRQGLTLADLTSFAVSMPGGYVKPFFACVILAENGRRSLLIELCDRSVRGQ